MSERIPSSEAPVQIAMVFGYNTPEVICDFSKVERSQVSEAYNLAADKFGSKAGSLGRYASLEEAEKAQAKILPVYEWTGSDWVERK